MSLLYCYLCACEIYRNSATHYHGIPVCAACVKHHDLTVGGVP